MSESSVGDSVQHRIEAVLEAHDLLPRNFIVEPAPPRCSCGQWSDSGPGDRRVLHNYREHVAAAVVASLGLTTEWGVITDMGVTAHVPHEERARYLADRYDDMSARSRWVSGWEVQP